MEANKLNRGVLFTNKRKEKDTHPDYTGSFVDANGKDFWVSSWINKSKGGETYMSFTVKAKDEDSSSSNQSSGGWKTPIKEESNDLPF